MVARLNSNPRTLSGTIRYAATPAGQTAKLVSGVSLTAAGASDAATSTNSNGSYSLENLLANEQYTITATKSGNANGISPFDATLVLRHVAANGTGANALNANQKIAADANGDGSISPFDATLILRYVAANGSNANTGQIGNWRFSPASRNYESLVNSLAGQDYEAILVGEINGNWTPPTNLVESDENAAIEASNETGAAPAIDSANPASDKLSSETNTITIEPKAAQRFNNSTADENTILIPVMLANEGGKSVSSYNFVVSFDPAAMQADFSKPFETTGTLSEGGNFTIVSDTNTPGGIGIAAVSLNGIAEKSGVLLNLRFKILETPRNPVMNTNNLAFLRNVKIEDDNGGLINAAGKNGFLELGRLSLRSKTLTNKRDNQLR
ncbi:MAG TPA: cohesin domain-containing protein, partial [Pyrinomonadaceae bacterium]|nr:cohesin domain-containing protein [Pyrinomonadaceae bacterium]